MSGDVDSFAPWSIKSFPNDARKMVIAAARRDGITVSAWLERLIRSTLGDDGLPMVAQETAQVKPPATSPGELPELVRLARELSPDGQDTPLLKEARTVVRERLRAMRRLK